jgi:hypothetical protein
MAQLRQIVGARCLSEWGPSTASTKHPYYDPDDLYQCDEFNEAAVFVYLANEGDLFFDHGNTHEDMIKNYGLHRTRYERSRLRWQRDRAMRMGDLIGRACLFPLGVEDGPADDVPQSMVVSFWNDEYADYAALLPCLKELQASGIIGDDYWISTPFHQTVHASAIGAARPVTTSLSDEEKRRLQMQRELHNMRPQQKKAAMAELGLATASTKNAWQAGAEQANLVQPGQKWWAMASEEAEALLAQIDLLVECVTLQ